MMNLSKFFILGCQFAFLGFTKPEEIMSGGYYTDFAAISADSGCSAVRYGKGNDLTYDYVCWGAPVKVFADPDGVYRVTVFSGFPDEDQTSERTHPKYKQDYSWKKYDLMTIAMDNCLWVKPRGSWFMIYLPWLARVWGQCPPTEYLWAGYSTNELNPYVLQQKDKEANNLKRQQEQKRLEKETSTDSAPQQQKELDKESSLDPNPQQPSNGRIDPAIVAESINLPSPDSFYDQDTAYPAAGLPARSTPSAGEFAFNSLPSKEIPVNSFEAPIPDSGNFFTRRFLRRHRIPIGKQEQS